MDAQRGKVIRGLRGQALHILEGEAALLALAAQVNHRRLVRMQVGHGVHDVEGEIEAVGVLETDALQRAVFIFAHADEFLADQTADIVREHVAVDDLRRDLFLARQHHRQEQAVVAVHGDHTVRGGGVVIDGVALVQDLDVVAHLHLQRAAEDQVEFLAGVRGGVDGLVLLLGVVIVAHPVGLGDLLAELGRQVLNADAALLRGGDAAALARDRVIGKMGAAALEQIRDLNAKCQRTFVDEGKRQIHRAGLVLAILVEGQLRLFRHFLHAVIHDAAHFADTQRDLLQLTERVVHKLFPNLSLIF